MKKIIKIAASAVTVACLSVSLSGGAIAASKVDSFKVGVVDYMTVFQMVPQGKEKLTELKKGVEPKVDALQKKQDDLQAQMEKLQKDAPTLTDKQKQSREQVLMKQQADFQKEVSDLQQNELAKEQDAATAFQDAVKSAVAKVGKKEGYDMVFNSQAVPYSKTKYDLSHDVIALMKKSS
jgi:outer membrane protein